MKLHKEGFVTIIVAFIVLLGLAAILLYIAPSLLWLRVIISMLALFMYFRIVFFFRVPKRKFDIVDGAVLSSADGEIVAIEEVFEEEFLKQKCIQVSVFMSPSNVHINWMPVTGKIAYFKYHPGKHFVAWHPKSSTLNERTSIGVRLANGSSILVRQIAGAMARRIVCYAQEGKTMKQTEEIGFIKFGSRVDLFLPLGTQVQVKLKDLVVGGQTTIATLS
ncbi:MAG: phosphatidylserine decarboxylase family protein [Bacteroidales bacterium]|nr:phosphatidylserine decarboxylase family protein [Bacteroidales bacterium]